MAPKIIWIDNRVNFFASEGFAFNPIGTELFAKKFKDFWKQPKNNSIWVQLFKKFTVLETSITMD